MSTLGARTVEVLALSRQQRRQLHREAEKRGRGLLPMQPCEAQAYIEAGRLKVTDVWALSGLDQVQHGEYGAEGDWLAS